MPKTDLDLRLAELKRSAVTRLMATDDLRIELPALRDDLRGLGHDGSETGGISGQAIGCAAEPASQIGLFVDHPASRLPAPRETLLDLARSFEGLFPADRDCALPGRELKAR